MKRIRSRYIISYIQVKNSLQVSTQLRGYTPFSSQIKKKLIQKRKRKAIHMYITQNHTYRFWIRLKGEFYCDLHLRSWYMCSCSSAHSHTCVCLFIVNIKTYSKVLPASGCVCSFIPNYITFKRLSSICFSTQISVYC